MTRTDSPSTRPGSSFAKAAALGLAYWLAVTLAIELVYPVDQLALFWPANAIAAAALILSSRRQWPLYLFAMAPAYLGATLPDASFPVPVYLAFCAANIAEVLIVAGAVKWFVRAPVTNETLTKVLPVAMLAAIPATLASALIGSPAVAWGIEQASLWRISVGWLTGDLSGLLLVLPMLLAWLAPGAPLVRSFSRGELIECAEVIAFTLTRGGQHRDCST